LNQFRSGTPKHRPLKRLSKLPRVYRGTLEFSQELTSLVLAPVANPRIDVRTQGGGARDNIDGFLVLLHAHAHAWETSVQDI
jgi:hypothetical protein